MKNITSLFHSRFRLLLGLVGIVLVLFGSALYAQSTIIKLSTADNTSSFNITKSDDTNLLRIFGDGGFYVGGTYGITGAIPLQGAGTRLMWYPAKAAFRVGGVDGTQWDSPNIAYYSIAMGYDATASGYYSTAMGWRSIASGWSSTAMGGQTTASGEYAAAMGAYTNASGPNSTAMGGQTTASGEYATAMGYQTQASGNYSTAIGKNTRATGVASTAMGDSTIANGDYSTAIGYRTTASSKSSTAMGEHTTASGYYSTAIGCYTTASGFWSTAMGYLTEASGSASTAMGCQTMASGNYSTAMGYNVSTNGMEGAFIIGDFSNSIFNNSTLANQMTMRFAGGYVLYSNSASTTGVHMDAGVNGWSNICDRNKKENFSPVDGEALLKKIREIPITEWSYKGADPTIRYMGPVAQDFYAAFHLGGTDSLGINTICIDGVNMAAVQALEKRTAELQKATAKIAELEKMIAEQKAELSSCNKTIDELKDEFIQLKKEITAALELKNPLSDASVAITTPNK